MVYDRSYLKSSIVKQLKTALALMRCTHSGSPVVVETSRRWCVALMLCAQIDSSVVVETQCRCTTTSSGRHVHLLAITADASTSPRAISIFDIYSSNDALYCNSERTVFAHLSLFIFIIKRIRTRFVFLFCWLCNVAGIATVGVHSLLKCLGQHARSTASLRCQGLSRKLCHPVHLRRGSKGGIRMKQTFDCINFETMMFFTALSKLRFKMLHLQMLGFIILG